MAEKKKADFSNTLKSLLLTKLEWFEQQLLKEAAESDMGHLTLAQSRIFAQLRGGEATLSDLARQLGVSRQAIQKTVAGLVELGLVELYTDPHNRSAKLVRETPEGDRLREKAFEWHRRIEKRVAETIGREDLEELKLLLSRPWQEDPEEV